MRCAAQIRMGANKWPTNQPINNNSNYNQNDDNDNSSKIKRKKNDNDNYHNDDRVECERKVLLKEKIMKKKKME